MKVVAIIQARMGSTRLSGKVLRKLQDKTIIEHIVDRVEECKYVDEVVIATPSTDINRPLIELLRDKKINVFSGSEDDVLERYVEAGKKYNADILVRITGDNPLTCPQCIDRMLKMHIENDVQYTTMSGLPLGVGSEIVNFNTLLQVQEEELQNYHREHVTIYIKENHNKYKINILQAPEEFVGESIRLTVDTEEDFEVVEKIYERLYKPGHVIGTRECIEFLNMDKEISMINKHIVQKKR